jgi:hypothetical protein
MDNPNYPILIFNPATKAWVKVMDSMVDEALSSLNDENDCQIYRVSHDARVIEKSGRHYIRAMVCHGPLRYERN